MGSYGTFLSQETRQSVSLVSTCQQCPANRLAHGDDVHFPKVSLHGFRDGSGATLHPPNTRDSYKVLLHSPEQNSSGKANNARLQGEGEWRRSIATLTSTTFQLLAAALPTENHKRQTAAVPSYVLSYAPKIWLQSQDPYFPSDIGAQLVHTKPEVNFNVVNGAPNPLTLDNLASLNNLGGSNVYLTSVDDVTQSPAWLKGVKPDSNGKTNGAKSCTVIVNDHGSGNVDAYYLYFYAFNQGNTVLGQEIGDHVGDWEHNMIRFKNGIPQSICTHDHTIPGLNLPAGPIEDHCDQGTLWDPIANAYFYSYDAPSNSFKAYDGTSPTNWLQYVGEWGDQQYPDSDRRQKKIFGIAVTAKYTSGPTGPEDKSLNRADVCPPRDNTACFVSPILRP
ncbi:MAG: hypothetical protein Q9203_005419 [Teloschistes exilis]